MAAAAVAGALGVVLSRNPIASVLALLVSFFALATIYLLAGFQLLAAAQILVYAGAILVLFLFVIMLLNLGFAGPMQKVDKEMFVRRRSAIAIAVTTAIFATSALAITALPEPKATASVPEHGLDTAESLAKSLFGPYALPFEATSLLLLATAVAVVMLAKRFGGGQAEIEARGEAEHQRGLCVPVPSSHLPSSRRRALRDRRRGFLLRRNVIVVLMCIELMLNAANPLLPRRQPAARAGDRQARSAGSLVRDLRDRRRGGRGGGRARARDRALRGTSERLARRRRGARGLACTTAPGSGSFPRRPSRAA